MPPQERRPGLADRVHVDLPLNPAPDDPVDPRKSRLQDGDVVGVYTIPDRVENWVQISGPVKQPGEYEYHDGMDVAELVGMAGNAWPDLLVDRALIDRTAPDGTYQAYHFSIGAALKGQGEKVLLRPQDKVRLFSKWEVQDRDSVSISGAVRKRVTFPFRQGMTLYDLILRAGGLIESADSIEADVSRMRPEAAASHGEVPPAKIWDVLNVPLSSNDAEGGRHFLLQAHDAVVIRSLPWWKTRAAVVLQGEVLYPGIYTLQHSDEKLAELISQAGGLKPDAFSIGARITRSKDLIGNVSVDLDCALKHPDRICNPVLLAGDTISIPEQPYTVKIIGAVGHPTSMVFEHGKKPGYYVSRAGGFAQGADRWKTRVVYPNGSSRTIRKFWSDPPVEAGSMIVVPLAPPKQKGDQLQVLAQMAAIFSSVATVFLVAHSLKN